MARSGLYKSDVKKARDALIAQGRHPSLDAVRIELGNTGSKSTIHKYLKELEAEDGGASGQKVSISEALQDLVARLAAQLQEEANARIAAVEARTSEHARALEEALNAAQQANEGLSIHVTNQEARLQQELDDHRQTREALQREAIARHTAQQQIADLKERLHENEAHRRSLEEKHQHAREALEHYRASVKEQRDQEARRHEQQVQQLQSELRLQHQSVIVKQEEVTKLNQEGARLVGDLSHSQKAVRELELQLCQAQDKLHALYGMEERARMLELNLASAQAQIGELTATLAQTDKALQAQRIEAAAVSARLEAQQAITTELRTYLDVVRPTAPHAAAASPTE